MVYVVEPQRLSCSPRTGTDNHAVISRGMLLPADVHSQGTSPWRFQLCFVVNLRSCHHVIGGYLSEAEVDGGQDMVAGLLVYALIFGCSVIPILYWQP